LVSFWERGEGMVLKFNKELWTARYWVHVLIIAVVVLGVLEFVKGGGMFTLKNILWSIPLIGVGDFLAHNITKLD